MMKKILKALSLVMVLVMCFTMVFTTAVSAEGTDTLTLSVDDNAAPKAGETVNITVTSNFTTVAGAHFAIDLAGLEYVSVAGDYAEYFSAETMNFVKEFNEENDNLVESGDLFVITATVPADAEAGTVYNVGFGTIAASKEFCDYNLNEVVVTKTGVAVTVAADEPVVPECEHTNVSYVSSVPATVSAEGTITLECADCGETITETLYYNKYARAGYSSANAEEQTLISFSAFYDKDFSRVDADASWDTMFITVNQSRNGEAIGSQVYTYADVEIGVSNSENAYKVYYGLPAYAYVDDMAASVYLYDSVDNKWYSGPENKTSLKALAESIIPSATGIKKSMWVDLLNYGAAAQANFNVNVENLANADIDAYQSAATTPEAYENNLSVSAGSDPTPFYYYMFTGVVESKITLRTYFRFPNKYTGTYAGETGENIKAVATWTSYTGETVTYEATLGEDGFNLLDGRNDRWDFYLPLGAPDLRANITFTIVYGEDEIVVSPVATCSFESYVADNYATGNDNFKALCDAMMAFGDSANAYLTQN